MKKFITIVCFITTIVVFGLNLYAQNIENREATISFFKGDVQIQKQGKSMWEHAKLRDALTTGDIIKTGQNSQVELRLDDGSILKIEENTTFEMIGRLFLFNAICLSLITY